MAAAASHTAAAPAAAAPTSLADDPRVAEVLSLRSIYEGQMECSDAFAEAAAALERGECDGDEAVALATMLHEATCSGTIHMRDGSREASLHFSLPPGYPAAAARCHAASPHLARGALDTLRAQLQQRASEAAQEAGGAGVECVYILAEALREALLEGVEDQQTHQAAAGAAVGGVAAASGMSREAAGSDPGGDPGDQKISRHRRVLLRFDHMRDRAMYTKTIRRWVKELGLTGRLVFCNALILLLLEGPQHAVGRYLVKARTEVVDVDSAGRKCRERMMDVLEDSDFGGTTGPVGQQHGNTHLNTHCNTQGGSSGATSSSSRGAASDSCGSAAVAGEEVAVAARGGTSGPLFADFGEVECSGYGEAAAALGVSEAALLQWAAGRRGR